MTLSKYLLTSLMIGFATLGGCAKVRYPAYYTLNLPAPVSAAQASDAISGTVAVREFRAPQYLKQGPIVYRPGAEQIAFYDYHYWAEDPRRTVTAAIVLDLQGAFTSVELYDGRGSAEFLLTGSIDHLEEVDQGSAVSVDVGISAKLQNVKSGEVIWSGTAWKSSKVEQRSVPGIVAEMSRDMNLAARELIVSMRGGLSKRSESNP